MLKKLFIAAVAALAVISSLFTTTYSIMLADRIAQVARSSHADMVYVRKCIRELEGELTQKVIDRLCDRLEEISRPVGGIPEESIAESVATEKETVAGTESSAASTETDQTEQIESVTQIPAETQTETQPVALIPPADSSATESNADSETLPEADTVPDTPSSLPSETLPASESIPTIESDAATESADEADVTTAYEQETSAETDSMEFPTHNRPETEAPSTEEIAPAPILYTVAAHEGRIGVFDATGRLIRTVNVFLFSLPEADREALTVGIPAYSREEMVDIVSRYE